MTSLYVDRRGVTLKADGEALVFYENAERVGTVPLSPLSRVFLRGDVTLSSSLLGKLGERGIGGGGLSGRKAEPTLLLARPHNDAARRLAERAVAGALSPARIDEAALEAELPSMSVGAVDLLVRTGGEQRISNFMLWGAAYAELYFSPALWPDWVEADLYEAITAYQQRDRRFGKVRSDVASAADARGPTQATTAGAGPAPAIPVALGAR